MTALKVEIRSGAYYDSVILMQLQSALDSMPGVTDTGVVMGTEANKDILAQSNLLVPEAKAAAPDDLIIVLRAEDESAAEEALGKVDELLTRKRSTEGQAYQPKSLEMGLNSCPKLSGCSFPYPAGTPPAWPGRLSAWANTLSYSATTCR